MLIDAYGAYADSKIGSFLKNAKDDHAGSDESAA